MLHIGKLLYDLATRASVCTIVRGTEECQGILQRLCNATQNWKSIYDDAAKTSLRSFAGQPMLSNLLDVYTRPASCEMPEVFWPFLQYLLHNCERAFPEVPILKKWQTMERSQDITNEAEMKKYQTNGQLYPNRPQQRPRGYYSGLDWERANACTHRFLHHQKKTGGLMSSFCPHLICQGSHIIVHAEGRKDSYRFLWSRLADAPKVVIYVGALPSQYMLPH